MTNRDQNYARTRITTPKGRGYQLNPDTLVSKEEREVYRLYHQTPGLSQAEIAAKLGKNQGQISRILRSALSKVSELKRLCSASGGDDGVVERYLDNEANR